MKSKAQSAIEFMVLIGAIMLFTAIFISFLNSRISDKSYEKRNLILMDTAQSLNDEITLAQSADDGYSRKFTLPDDIINSEYSIQILDGLIYTHTLDSEHALSIPTLNVSGQPTPGKNTIRNSQNQIYLNQ